MTTSKYSVLVLIASLSVTLHAQAPPQTNAQLLMKVATLEQEIARLTVLCGAPCAQPAPSVSVGHQQTLGEAAAEAAKVHHEWAASANVVPRFDPSAQPAPATVSPISAASAVPAVATGQQDEAYWKNRARSLKTALDNDRSFQAAAVIRERALNARLHRNADDSLYIRNNFERATVDGQWQDAVAEVSRFTALVQNDTRAIADLELEAHRANVPPGWLVIK